MPLPTIVTPTFEIELISNSKKIEIRPFLVKEEKYYRSHKNYNKILY